MRNVTVNANRALALTRFLTQRTLVILLHGAIIAMSPALRAGDRLQASGGVTQLEGSGGGGLVPWALITGLGTEQQVGGSGFCTDVAPSDFTLESCGLALGLYDRLELSVAREHLSLGSTAPGNTLSQTILGAKLRLFGDAVIDQDSLWPQLALGVQYKRNSDFDSIPRLLGARHEAGTDVYLAATKIWLAGPLGRTWLADLTLCETDANQLGLLGFGGDLGQYHLEPEASLGMFVTDDIVAGVEERRKPNNLSVFRENEFKDVFLVWWPIKYLSFTVAYADLGNIANQSGQRGVYASLQASW
jgi:hypothetical protein